MMHDDRDDRQGWQQWCQWNDMCGQCHSGTTTMTMVIAMMAMKWRAWPLSHQQLDKKSEVLGQFWISEKKIWNQICWSEISEKFWFLESSDFWKVLISGKFWFLKNFWNSELFRSSEFKSESFRSSDLWSDYFQIFRFFVKLLIGITSICNITTILNLIITTLLNLIITTLLNLIITMLYLT